MKLRAVFSFPDLFVIERLEIPFELRHAIHHRTERHFYNVRRVLYSTSLRHPWRPAHASVLRDMRFTHEVCKKS